MTSSGAPFLNAARNLRQLGSAYVAWGFVLFIVAVQLVVTQVGGQELEPARSWYIEFGLSRSEFLNGKIWQLFTYGFLHGGWFHVGLNALFILLIGSRVEHITGSKMTLTVLFAGVIAGGLVHLILTPGTNSSSLLVGISGGCMALLLMLTTLSPQSRMMPIPVSGRSLGLGIMVAELILALVDPTLNLPGFSAVGKLLVESGVGSWFLLGHACHVGGGMAGWLMARSILRPRITLDRLRRDRLRREANDSQRRD